MAVESNSFTLSDEGNITDTRPHFWFQIIEDVDVEFETLCAENLRDDIVYYYGAYEDGAHNIYDFDFQGYDDYGFYIAPNSIMYFNNSMSCFVIEENKYNEILDIIYEIGAADLESILDVEPNLQYQISNIFNYPNGEGYIGEYIPPTSSWSINNKIVQSLHIGNKEIQTIERVSDGALIYQRTPVYELTLESNKATASLNEAITFTAILLYDNQPVHGKTVTFTDGTNILGTSTTINGIATLTYSWSTDSNLSIKSIYDNVESNSVNIKVEEPPLTLTFTGSSFVSYSNMSKGLIGSDMVIDWGDGTSESITSGTKLPSHTYSTSGTHTIKVTGEITSLGSSCFYACTGLTDVTIPSGVTSLESSCFYGCTGLTDVTIPSGVTSLGSGCFYGCTGLTDVTIPSGVTSLGSTCFDSCTGLTDVTIPSSVTSLGSGCFRNCTNVVNYQLYWQTPPVSWSKTLMPNRTNTYFTIPNGTTANYVAKSFPSAKLIERSA